MNKNFSDAPFERYADDCVIHVKTQSRAKEILRALEARMAEVKLELHPQKTKIIYCKDSNRKQQFPNIRFSFLGFDFAPRSAKSKTGTLFTSFIPAASKVAIKRMGKELRGFRLHLHTDKSISEIAKYYNPVIGGWVNYYGRFYKTKLTQLLRRINFYLIRWAMRKYKRLRRQRSKAWSYIISIAQRQPDLFAHWAIGIIPSKVGLARAV